MDKTALRRRAPAMSLTAEQKLDELTKWKAELQAEENELETKIKELEEEIARLQYRYLIIETAANQTETVNLRAALTIFDDAEKMLFVIIEKEARLKEASNKHRNRIQEIESVKKVIDSHLKNLQHA
jgi:hypothetical protein